MLRTMGGFLAHALSRCLRVFGVNFPQNFPNDRVCPIETDQACDTPIPILYLIPSALILKCNSWEECKAELTNKESKQSQIELFNGLHLNRDVSIDKNLFCPPNEHLCANWERMKLKEPNGYIPLTAEFDSYFEKRLWLDEYVDRRGNESNVKFVSHRWESAHHPDPNLTQLNMLKQYITIMNFDGYIFYDYVSLYQHPRSKVEEKLFRISLSLLTELIMHCNLWVISSDDYHERAWCFYEQICFDAYDIEVLNESKSIELLYTLRTSFNNWYGGAYFAFTAGRRSGFTSDNDHDEVKQCAVKFGIHAIAYTQRKIRYPLKLLFCSLEGLLGFIEYDRNNMIRTLGDIRATNERDLQDIYDRLYFMVRQVDYNLLAIALKVAE